MQDTKEFDRQTANKIWQKVKGKPVPETYSDKECEDIVKRYWHKAMESEQ